MGTVRIELHEKEADDYTRLHRQMRRLGFTTEIKGRDGNRYKLPTGIYYYAARSTAVVLREMAKEAASAANVEPATIFTTDGASAWVGLPRVDEPD